MFKNPSLLLKINKKSLSLFSHANLLKFFLKSILQTVLVYNFINIISGLLINLTDNSSRIENTLAVNDFSKFDLES